MGRRGRLLTCPVSESQTAILHHDNLNLFIIEERYAIMRRLTWLTCALLFAAGCAQGPAPGPAPKSKGTIGVSVLTLTNPFFKEIGDVLTDVMSKHGYRVVVVSGENRVADQQKQVKDFLQQGVVALVLCPCDSRAVGAVIEEANAQGVPVFTADIKCLAPGAKVVTHVATANYDGGKQAAEAMIEALGPAGGKVAILDFKDVESCIARVKGFRTVIDAHNVKAASGKLTIVTELAGNGQKDTSYKSALDALQAHPDLAGIFAINDPSALGAWAALEKTKMAGQVKIIGFDGQPEGKRAILEGKIYADPIQRPDEIARKTAGAILDYFRGETPPLEIPIATQLYRKADAEKELRR